MEVELCRTSFSRLHWELGRAGGRQECRNLVERSFGTFLSGAETAEEAQRWEDAEALLRSAPAEDLAAYVKLEERRAQPPHPTLGHQ